MTRTRLLEELKAETERAVSDMLLPVSQQKGDTENSDRPAAVYLMRLPDSKSATKKAPYILHQLITGEDVQKEGERDESTATVRTIFGVYSHDEQEGGLRLLELTERLRIHLLRRGVIGKMFVLDKRKGVETFIYPENTAPYYAGEMLTTWQLPAVQREVRECL